MSGYTVRSAREEEHPAIGQLLVRVYSALEGFPKQEDQPAYYELLAQVGRLTENASTKLLVAVTDAGEIHGAVVFFEDMRHYGSGGSAPQEADACGFRLLAVAPEARGHGVGKLLSAECIERTRAAGKRQVVIHSTKAMSVAWGMYERLGFERSAELDFVQQGLQVYGFRLILD